MGEPRNGLEFLKGLKGKNGKKTQSHSTLTDYLEKKARKKGVPLYGQFELTPLCNFNCKMCYVHLDSNQLEGRKPKSVEEWKDLMHQAYEAGMMHATLTGGECLAYPGFEELFLYLHGLGCEVTVLTNGYLLDEGRIDFFKRHTPAKIQITLYGYSDDVYERVTGRRAFNTVVENTVRAIKAGLSVDIYITPSTFLGEDVFETIRVARSITKNIYINSTLFDPRVETGRSGLPVESDAELYVRIYRLLNELDGIETVEIDEDRLPPAGGPYHECDKSGLECGGGRSCFVMDWKGTLLPCNRLTQIHADSMSEGFKNAWAKVNTEANNWPRIPECRECAYEDVCKNCAAETIRYAQPGKMPLGLCEKTRYFARHGIVHVPECKAPSD